MSPNPKMLTRMNTAAPTPTREYVRSPAVFWRISLASMANRHDGSVSGARVVRARRWSEPRGGRFRLRRSRGGFLCHRIDANRRDRDDDDPTQATERIETVASGGLGGGFAAGEAEQQ